MGGDLLGLICPEIVNPVTDLEDERPTPVGSPSSAVDESMPLSTTSGVDLEVAHVLLDVGVLPAMVTPIVDPAMGLSITPAMYPVPPVPMLSFVDSVPLGVTSPASPALGSEERGPVAPGIVSRFGSFARTLPFFAGVTISTGCQSAIWFGCYGPGVAVEFFAAVGGVRGLPLPSGSPDTLLDGPGDGCPWVGCVFPGRGYRDGWKPPEDARFVSGGDL